MSIETTSEYRVLQPRDNKDLLFKHTNYMLVGNYIKKKGVKQNL